MPSLVHQTHVSIRNDSRGRQRPGGASVAPPATPGRPQSGDDSGDGVGATAPSADATEAAALPPRGGGTGEPASAGALVAWPFAGLRPGDRVRYQTESMADEADGEVLAVRDASVDVGTTGWLHTLPPSAYLVKVAAGAKDWTPPQWYLAHQARGAEFAARAKARIEAARDTLRMVPFAAPAAGRTERTERTERTNRTTRTETKETPMENVTTKTPAENADQATTTARICLICKQALPDGLSKLTLVHPGECRMKRNRQLSNDGYRRQHPATRKEKKPAPAAAVAPKTAATPTAAPAVPTVVPTVVGVKTAAAKPNENCRLCGGYYRPGLDGADGLCLHCASDVHKTCTGTACRSHKAEMENAPAPLPLVLPAAAAPVTVQRDERAGEIVIRLVLPAGAAERILAALAVVG